MPKKISEHINAYCTYCKAEGKEKVKAVWRLSYRAEPRACQQHHPDILSAEQRYAAINRREYSEGDYQSWLRH